MSLSTGDNFSDDKIMKLLDRINYLPNDMSNTRKEFYHYFEKYNLCKFQEMEVMQLIKDILDLKNLEMKEKLIYFVVYGYFSSTFKVGQFSLCNTLMYLLINSKIDNDKKVLTKMIYKTKQAQYAYNKVTIKVKFCLIPPFSSNTLKECV